MSSSEIDEPIEKLDQLVQRLGGIPLRRVLLQPPLGTAQEKDLLEYERKSGRACELIDGTLVEKDVGLLESFVGIELARFLANHVAEQDLGIVSGEQGGMRILPGLVRIPDISFVRWSQLPGKRLPREKIPTLYPDLAVEILSESNTPEEMQRKLKEYFLAGTTLVWLVDPQNRSVTVYSAPDALQVCTEEDTLDGGTLLPGFALKVARLFERLPRALPSKPRRKSRKK